MSKEVKVSSEMDFDGSACGLLLGINSHRLALEVTHTVVCLSGTRTSVTGIQVKSVFTIDYDFLNV